MDTDKLLFRCSALGDIMTEPKKGVTGLSETAKNFCKSFYRAVKYKRHIEIYSKYLEKGTLVEAEAIQMYSDFKGIEIVKNERSFDNDFIKGTPDILIEDYTSDGEVIYKEVYDTKCSWDLFTLPFATDNIDKKYYWQLQGYMALTGATSAKIVYCLVNTPGILIANEINYALKKVQGRENVEEIFPTIKADIERNMIFDDIPINERIVEFCVKRDDAAIQRIFARVNECREFIKTNLDK